MLWCQTKRRRWSRSIGYTSRVSSIATQEPRRSRKRERSLFSGPSGTGFKGLLGCRTWLSSGPTDIFFSPSWYDLVLTDDDKNHRNIQDHYRQSQSQEVSHIYVLSLCPTFEADYVFLSIDADILVPRWTFWKLCTRLDPFYIGKTKSTNLLLQIQSLSKNTRSQTWL